MKNQDKTRNTLPSNEAILNKKADFLQYAKKVAAGEIKVAKKETIGDKLQLIKDELKLLRGTPYSALKLILKEQLGLSVGEDTLRNFCQSELGFDKKPSARNTKKAA